MDALIDTARFTEDPAQYDAAVRDFVTLCVQDVPVVPLNQPIHDVALKKALAGTNSGSIGSRISGNLRSPERPTLGDISTGTRIGRMCLISH